jgi:hypothetical protein
MDDGTSTVGREIPKNKIEEFMRNVGKAYERENVTNEDLHSRLESRKVRSVELSNGWTLKPVRVQNENRIEIVGVNPFYWNSLQDAGAIRERVGYSTRWFIPTGEAGKGVMNKVLVGKDVIDVIDGDQTNDFSDILMELRRTVKTIRHSVLSQF